VVGIAGKQRNTIGTPGQGYALRGLSLRGGRDHLRLQVVHQLLALEVPDLNRRTGRHTQPIAVGREAQGVYDVVVVQSVQMLAFIQVPQHRLKVLSSRRAKGAVGRYGNGVQVSRVSDMVSL